jgi:SulP family sulfate permease
MKWFAPRDLVVGFTNAVTNIPDAMANAVLIGVSPVFGLYALVVGTPVAALATSSQFMTVATTGGMALVVADGLAGVTQSQQIEALVVLTVLVGVIQIGLGVVRAGALMRFVSNAVLRGFLTGVAVNIVLSQLADFTGYKSEAANKVVRAVDTLLHPGQMQWQVLAIGVLTVALVLLVERTPLTDYAFVVALVVSTAVAQVLKLGIPTVASLAEIPQGLPSVQVPSLGLIGSMAIPAISVALVGLVQAAGISKTVANADGTYPKLNRDFWGQGLGNLASGVFGGLPIGGSVGSTAMVVQLGAVGRLANFIVGPIIALVLLFLSGAVEIVPMTVLAALLIIIGVRAVSVPAIRTVLQTSVPSATLMIVTFVATLLIPVQYAVLLGVALSIVAYVYSSSLDIRVVLLEPGPSGRYMEEDAPAQLPNARVTALDIYGSVFYAGTDVIEKLIPKVGEASRPVAIIRLRGRTDVGSTFITFLDRYHGQVAAVGGRLMLAGVGADLMEQLTRSGCADVLGLDNLFPAEEEIMASMDDAIAEGTRWLESTDADSKKGATP